MHLPVLVFCFCGIPVFLLFFQHCIMLYIDSGNIPCFHQFKSEFPVNIHINCIMCFQIPAIGLGIFLLQLHRVLFISFKAHQDWNRQCKTSGFEKRYDFGTFKSCRRPYGKPFEFRAFCHKQSFLFQWLDQYRPQLSQKIMLSVWALYILISPHIILFADIMHSCFIRSYSHPYSPQSKPICF